MQRRLTRRYSSTLLRRLPAFRGKWHIAAGLHRLLFAPGDEPLAEVMMKNGYKMVLDLRATSQFRSFYTGDYDSAAIRMLTRRLAPGSTAIDIGSNVGLWTVPLARSVSPGGRVYAFEPHPTNVVRIRENLRRNRIGDEVVRVFEAGLSDREGFATLLLHTDFPAGATTGNATIGNPIPAVQSVEIRTQSLDSFVESERIERIDFIKIDVEGYEPQVLAGAARSIQRFRPIIRIELNDGHWRRNGILNPTAFCEHWLGQYGYASAFLTKKGLRFRPVSARKPFLDDMWMLPNEIAAYSSQTT